MSEYGRDESAPTPGGVFRGYFVGVRCIINNPFAAKWQAVSSRRGRFIVPAYIYSTCICNPFETHSRNVRNVFVICVLHIRRVKVWFLFFECCVVAICQQHYWQAVSSCRGRFIVPAYIYSTCICNPFETYLCNVRNVFAICVLHIRRVKVWFLRCKSMVFGVQKGGFYIAKVWFLQCKKGVFIFWLRHSYNVAMY